MAWLPLESNPEVMNKFLQFLGLPDKWQLTDVYGLDEDALAMVPRPALALIMLFPSNEKYESYRLNQEKEIEAKGQTVSENVFFVRQFIENTCGTVALIHSVGNNLDQIELRDGHLKQFYDDTKKLISPEEKGKLLMKAIGIMNAHKEVAREGQTEVPDPSEQVNFHFVSFIHKDGNLYELDGRRSFPINHGPTTYDTLLEDAGKIVKQYIARDPDNLNFTLIALTANFV